MSETATPPAPPTDGPDADVLAANLVRFGRVLRRAGLNVDAEQTRRFAEVLAIVGFDRREDVKAAGRAVFVRRREERAIFDAMFDLFWRRSTVVGGASEALPRIRQQDGAVRDVDYGPDAPADVIAPEVQASTLPVSAATEERLRTADFGSLTPIESRDAMAMLSALRPRLPLRSARRQRLARSGDRLALRTMARRSLATGGEALDWRWWRRTRRPRSIVLVCDISGSMERYTRFLLRFAHAFARSGAPVETFVFGTSLTRITREMRSHDPDVALARVADTVRDWSGGTRIGESVRALNRNWVRRTVRSSAIVLVISDGWERGDARLLGREMATLRRSCHRLIWLSPFAARANFAPTTQGLLAALPHVDDFMPCANIASLEALASHLAALPAIRTAGARP